jgi:hypothetical protein
MANQNLSQFTEKTLVADADWVFVWDAANSISKKVSRNSLLNSGTLATSAPVTISQTWAAVGQTFKALVVNAAGTSDANSAAASLLLDLQVGGVSQFSVRKSGQVIGSDGTALLPTYGFFDAGWGTGFSGWYRFGTGVACSTAGGTVSAFSVTHTNVRLSSANLFGWTATTAEAAADTILLRDGLPNTLALRNSTAAQTFNVYGTYSTSPSLAYSRLAIACDTSGNATLTTQSTGTAGTVSINGVPVGRGKTNEVNSVAVGTGTLTSVTSGAYNAALGLNALQVDTSGGFNSAFGVAALGSNTTANGNTALGYGALYSNTTGENNIAVGSGAGSLLANGVTSNVNSGTSVFLGVNTKALGASQTNQIVIGYDATGLGSNTAVLGNASITTTALRGNVGIGTTAPSSKLQVTGGDVEIETVTSGIIMKAAGTSTRYRITLNATGDALVFTAV